jgi:hypothetical protein
LPPNLKPLIVGEESTPEPDELPNALYEPGVVYQLTTDGHHIRRQAGVIAGVYAQKDWAENEAQATSTLSPELEEVLQSEHDARIARAKAQAEYNRKLTDAAYELAEEKEKTPGLFGKKFLR